MSAFLAFVAFCVFLLLLAFFVVLAFIMMCIVIIAQYADCTPCGFGSRQKVRSVVHPRAAILHFDGSG